MIVRSLFMRLLLCFGLTQGMWLVVSPDPCVQAGGTVTNCSDDSQFSQPTGRRRNRYL